MKIPAEIAGLFFAAIITSAIALMVNGLIYVKGVAREAARDEIREHIALSNDTDARIDSLEDSVFGSNLKEGESP